MLPNRTFSLDIYCAITVQYNFNKIPINCQYDSNILDIHVVMHFHSYTMMYVCIHHICMCCTAPPSRRPKQEVAVAAHTPAAPLAEAMPPAKKKAKTHKEEALAVQTAAWACKFRNLLNYEKSDACKKASFVCIHTHTCPWDVTNHFGYLHIYIIQRNR